ncbi:type VI secretion system-associated protein TagF [Erwinia sp. 198]|uniref:type VI secretion system-associated protein TagF n=1 Tax=Erwinia sp. 198 TaxID=2022746 RepID=UPI000F665C86|nr:type VI secretion system-associated protein TagF [Erwinia sp. 198]RRZ90344.1 type VI secretion system-associated protein TagF [Erwinia sp. 198]
MTEKSKLGWYGKLPGTGDFLQRRLPEPIVASWSNWFQLGLSHWYQHGEAVGELFSRAPVWNFALPATLGVQRVQIGCLLPSRDRVGRSWPLLALQSVPVSHWHPAQLAVSGDWFRALGEALHRAVSHTCTPTQLEQALLNLPPLSLPDTSRSDIMDVIGYQDLPCTLAWHEVANRFDPMRYTSYWWTNQSDGYPLASHKHSGNLTARLFTQLFDPAAVAQPGRHGLYPPMFE